MKNGFVKVAAGTPEIRVADVEFNKDSILALVNEADGEGAKILCLPELCLTGCTCGDLFLQDTLINGVEKALSEILEKTANTDMLFALGLPVRREGRIYNCAAVCKNGKLLWIAPKSTLSAGEMRWFADGKDVREEMVFAGCNTWFSGYWGVEVCGVSVNAAVGCGAYNSWAQVTLNPAADPETMGRAKSRCEELKSFTAQTGAAIIRAGAGLGESTTDAVYAGHCIIAAKGEILAEKRFESGLVTAQVDVSGFGMSQGALSTYATFESLKPPPLPFVPENSEDLEDALRIAARGLSSRMRHIRAEKAVIGVSGGLDSTLALLICARAMDELNLSRENIIAITMPGFGTTRRTKNNAEIMTRLLGATFREISIADAVRQHFADIGHDENDRGAVFENAQARERTQILMDIANGCGGLAVGTGDMSELALGWATYNGDHMSMYGVNAGIPKTLARALVAYVADTEASLSPVLRDVLETPVSPELLPLNEGGHITEELIGPYELHDFFLYHIICKKSAPSKVLRLAEAAFEGAYDRETVINWLKVFIKRFFSQQFKRSCMPDAPQITELSLSPRGGLVMPSDAVGALWLRELDDLT